MNPILEMVNITKTFGDVIANENASLTVKKNSIHALIGENGAGKSTLMNVLCGLHKPDSGKIFLNGKEVSIDSTHDAIDIGIGMVHQHFMLVMNLTVLENIIMGPNTQTRFGLTNYRKEREEVSKLMDEYEFRVDLDKKIRELSVGEMQRVEILKALYRGAEILILDEPTAVLTPQEIDRLFVMLRHLTDIGKTIVIITHKLKEILAISDEVTVMRSGKVTGYIPTVEANEQILASMMVGRDVVFRVEKEKSDPENIIFEVKNLSAVDGRQLEAIKDLSFTVRANEIVGIAGVDGNGQSELIEVITGLRKKTKGEIFINNHELTNETCLGRRRKGISHIPSDRMIFGINETCTIQENLILDKYRSKPFMDKGMIKNKLLRKYSEDLIEEYSVAASSPEVVIGNLSGGNMQKVVVAREMSSSPDLLIAANPTRGVDVGAIEFIHKEIIKLRDKGKAVLLVSTELDEILSLSDRILVIYEGEIVAEFDNENIDELELGLYMTGSKSMEMAI